MNINIFKKVYDLMEEYEKLLDNKDNKTNNIFKKTDDFINKDSFFNYIYNNISIQQRNNENINKIDLNNSKDINKDININSSSNIELSDINSSNTYLSNAELSDINSSNINLENNNSEKNTTESENINNQIEKDNTINDFIKKLYKKIILKCHPDKNGDKIIFIKCQEYYEQKLLIGLLYIAYIMNYPFPYINDIIINKILIEIRIVQYNIELLKKKNIT